MTAPKSSTSPLINPSENGPYIVKGLETLTNSKGETLSTKPTIALCRCGGSANKPFCDGTHATNGFNSQKLEGRTPDRRDNYEGKEITLHDNRGLRENLRRHASSVSEQKLFGPTAGEKRLAH